MLLSFNWLKDFINIPASITPENLGEILTLHTVEVEATKNLGANLDKVIVGEIIKLEPHPNADRLKLATVNIGKEKKRVVCGGSNLYIGMKVAFAQIGARIKWHGQGELVELRPAEIRGVKSEGMICAGGEVGLENLFPAKDEREVIDLQGRGKNGEPLAAVLNLDDIVYEIDNKSITHRPDLWSHYGMARDLAAVLGVKLTSPVRQPAGTLSLVRRGNKGEVRLKVKVEDSKLCPRYMAMVVGDVEVKPSPAWMQKRLISCGLRPINNIVDNS
ncbi:MAG: phenylalanine--tRNA ligase beta subunit-related protein, partial [Patescibacteria group bacterium]